jgi:hypothetical protein
MQEMQRLVARFPAAVLTKSDVDEENMTNVVVMQAADGLPKFLQQGDDPVGELRLDLGVVLALHLAPCHALTVRRECFSRASFTVSGVWLQLLIASVGVARGCRGMIQG